MLLYQLSAHIAGLLQQEQVFLLAVAELKGVLHSRQTSCLSFGI